MRRLPFENVIAYNAESPRSAMALITYSREYLARVKLFLDLLFILTYSREYLARVKLFLDLLFIL